MRIPTFPIVIYDCCLRHEFHDSCLVIDAQNFFYNCYKDSKLHYELGAECDQYAKYLKQHLNMFKEANIKCYFIFKGGTKNIEKKIEKDQNNPEKAQNVTRNPIFTWDVNVQVLDEMEFDYVFSEYQAKTDCIALAKMLSCPVLSMDIEFALSGVAYIPTNTLRYNANKNILNCQLFTLDNLLQKFTIDKDRLAAFILLTDLNIFPENSFTQFFQNNRMSQFHIYTRNIQLLFWLSSTPMNIIIDIVSRHTMIEHKRLTEELDKTTKQVNGEVDPSLAIECILKKEIVEGEKWFQKGVALAYIAKPYVDLYQSKILFVTGPQNEAAENPIVVAFNVIKYAYDLLTNFQSDGFKFIYNNKVVDSKLQKLLISEYSIKKPTYEAKSCVFENGWDHICDLNLFQHFMIEEVLFDFNKLEDAPDDAKMLLIALIYFNHKKTDNTDKIAYSVLLSHVILSVIKENDDLKLVSAADSKLVAELLKKYFVVTKLQLKEIKDAQLLYPLLEFQYCLRELNYLNKLCGSPFKPTNYSNTFNGTFVYKIVHSMQKEDETTFINKILEAAPNVLHFVNELIRIYKKIL